MPTLVKQLIIRVRMGACVLANVLCKHPLLLVSKKLNRELEWIMILWWIPDGHSIWRLVLVQLSGNELALMVQLRSAQLGWANIPSTYFLKNKAPGNEASLWNKIMWRIDPLLGNDSVNTFPREPTRATVGRLLLGNRSVNKPSQQQKGYVFCMVRTEGQRRSFELVVRSWESSVEEELVLVKEWVEFWRWQWCWFRRNGKKRMKLRQENFMCDFKLQWDSDISVARIRLV
jgi:hypothetical protein